MDSITLSWSQPDHPNGVILDYELQYYEKVGSRRAEGWMTAQGVTSLPAVWDLNVIK